jgi:hypothetical protein
MNTILAGGLPHHFPITLQNVCEEIDELAAWKGLQPVPDIPYSDGLRPA